MIGYIVMFDVWIDGNGRTLLNFSIYFPNITMLFKLVDAFTHVKGVTLLYELLDGFIQELCGRRQIANGEEPHSFWDSVFPIALS